jgi:hypothetical protein
MTTTAEVTDATRAASALLDRAHAGDPSCITRISGGGNSRVHRVDTDAGAFALKVYFRDGHGGRHRRATEFAALSFLRRQGVLSVPEPLASDAALGASLFSYIDGAVVPSEQATAADVEHLANFLVALRRLCKQPGAVDLPAASEAMFSLDALVANISRRRQRLAEAKATTATHALLTEFLQDQFDPTLAAAVDWARGLLNRHGLAPDRELEHAARTLSPSDFGFHNVLRTRDGRLVFVDFEYFGWDDPAKMVSDFLLHPGMALGKPLRGHFLSRVLAGFGAGDPLAVRIRVAYVLYALKWCMIVLNEFVPEHLQRRLFANPGSEPEDLQRRQLAKANALLAQARDGLVVFPYEEWMCL